MIYDVFGKVYLVWINLILEICGRLERVKRKKKNDEVIREMRLRGGLKGKIKVID